MQHAATASRPKGLALEPQPPAAAPAPSAADAEASPSAPARRRGTVRFAQPSGTDVLTSPLSPFGRAPKPTFDDDTPTTTAHFTRRRSGVDAIGRSQRRGTVDLSAFDIAPMLEDFGAILERGALQKEMAGLSTVAKTTRTEAGDIAERERLAASERARERILQAAAEKTIRRFEQRRADDAEAARRRKEEREQQRRQKDAALACLSEGRSSVAARHQVEPPRLAAGRMVASVSRRAPPTADASGTDDAEVATASPAASPAPPQSEASPAPRRPDDFESPAEQAPAASQSQQTVTSPPRRPTPPRRDIVDRNIANIRVIEDAMLVERRRERRSPLRLREHLQRQHEVAAGGHDYHAEQGQTPRGFAPQSIVVSGPETPDTREFGRHPHRPGAAGAAVSLGHPAISPSRQTERSSADGSNVSGVTRAISMQGPDKAETLAAARARRNAALRESRQRHAQHAEQRAQAFAENSKSLAELNDTVMRIASWQVTVFVVVAFRAMDEQSTAIIRREREARRRRAQLVMITRIPHLFRMYRRRKRIKMLRRAAVTVWAWVRFKGMLKYRAARVLRRTLRLVQGDLLIVFRAYVRTIRSVKRLTARKAHFRRDSQHLLQRQWNDMELYMLLTRPELVLSASELRECPRLRRLDQETSANVRAAIERRNQLAIRAAELESSMTGSVKYAPPETNPDLGLFTLVPQELVPAAYGDAPYFQFLTQYKQYCHKASVPLLPPEIDAPAFRVLHQIRNREIYQYRRAFFRKQMRAARSSISTHFSSQRTAVDMLSSAMRTRRGEAVVKVRARYPAVLTGTPLHRVLVELEVKTSRASPLVQALVDSCQEVLQEPFPRPPRLRVLYPRLELQRVVEQALNHSKLVRLLQLTATDLPPGFEM